MLRAHIEATIGWEAMHSKIRRLVSLLYRLGDVETTLLDPITAAPMDLMREMVPLRIDGTCVHSATTDRT